MLRSARHDLTKAMIHKLRYYFLCRSICSRAHTVSHVCKKMKTLLSADMYFLVSGARGLGWNMAQALSEVGIKAIAILDYNQEFGDKAAAELFEHTGIPSRFYKVDVRDGKAITEVVHHVAQTFGSVDVVINSAGIAE